MVQTFDFEFVLKSPACRAELQTRAKGIVEGFWRLYNDDFYDIRVPVPEPDEQRLIVRFLDWHGGQTANLIRAKKKLIALLNEQKQAIIHRAVTRGLDPNVKFKPSGVLYSDAIGTRVMRAFGDAEHRPSVRVKQIGTIEEMAMIEFTTGDILKADVEALVNTVNCVGIMGRGVALQFKNDFPQNFKAYQATCARNELRPGKMFVFETGPLTNPKFIINFPTKRHWRGKSRMEDIHSGMKALVEEIRNRGIRSIAIPPSAAALAVCIGPKFALASRQHFAASTNLSTIVYEPNQAPVATKSRDVPKMTPGRVALVVLMHRYLGGLMDPFVSLLEMHKLV